MSKIYIYIGIKIYKSILTIQPMTRHVFYFKTRNEENINTKLLHLVRCNVSHTLSTLHYLVSTYYSPSSPFPN